ncbi:MAG: hypothetical protein JWO00_356 [Candidatus Parcubacteria bacterium]|nr:hypothetical protein [Candidatus Parcubacteria bacterium]
MSSEPFFSFDLHQQINQWLCIALVALLGFLVCLYYFVNKAEAFGNFYVAATVTNVPAYVPTQETVPNQ